MTHASLSLYQANLAALTQRDVHAAEMIRNLSAADRPAISERVDGYCYGAANYRGQDYFISREERIELDLLDFRREIHRSVEDRADLLFLLGVGLGYRLRAAVETLEGMGKGYLVLLEPQWGWMDAACRCSDLRPVFLSPRCQWPEGDLTESSLARTLRLHHWYGARKFLFFWGYQTACNATRGLYESMIPLLNRMAQQEQSAFFERWQGWVQSRDRSSPSGTVAALFETKNGSPINAAALQRLRERQEGRIVDIPISLDSFTASTWVVEQVMRHNADEIVCVGFPPERWILPPLLSTCPIPVREVGI